jgi:predicted ATPase
LGQAADPEHLKQSILRSLVELVYRASCAQPVLLVCEDIHWIDPSSEELLGLLLERVHRMRVLVLATFRPSYQAPWIGLPFVTLLALNRLAPEQAALIVSYVARHRNVSQSTIDRIVSLADGIPLFLEELSRTAFSADLEPKKVVASSDAEPAIPATLSDSLAARLDQLGADREAAQVCSVIGRSFDVRLASKLTGRDEQSVAVVLDKLVSLGLASVRGRGPHAVYTFRHALIQESAYRSMLRSKRQAVHLKLAGIYTSSYGRESDPGPEILAYHYEQGGVANEAIQYLHLAAQNALVRSANIEAIRLLERALRLLMTMPDNADRDLLELSLLVSLGSPRLSISGPGAPEVRELYRRAIELCRRLPDSPHHFAAHWGWWFTSRDNREALDRATHLSKLAEALGQEELILQAHHCQWSIQFCLGDHCRTLEYIEKGLEIYERGNFCHHGMLYGGHDPKACGLGERALSLWLTGQYDQSLKAIEEVVDHARALNHAGTIRHSRDQRLCV